MDKRLLERHLRQWLRRGKVVTESGHRESTKGRLHSPTTAGGLPVEGQIRKEWDPRKGGLPVFFGVPSG